MDPERRAAHAVEFLEVAVHAICKERRVYEPSIYGSRRCFGVPVPHARYGAVAKRRGAFRDAFCFQRGARS